MVWCWCVDGAVVGDSGRVVGGVQEVGWRMGVVLLMRAMSLSFRLRILLYSSACFLIVCSVV